MKQSRFPPGWDEERVHQLIAHYEGQTEEAIAEDEAAFEDEDQLHTVMEVPKELVPAIRELIARHQA
jgi:hypothetical protein